MKSSNNIEELLQFARRIANGGDSGSVEAERAGSGLELFAAEDDSDANPREVGHSVEELLQFADHRGNGGGHSVEVQGLGSGLELVAAEDDSDANPREFEHSVEELLQFGGHQANGGGPRSVEAEGASVGHGVEELLHNFACRQANGGGRQRSLRAEAGGSRLELLAENDSDANLRRVERSVEELLHNFSSHRANGGGRQRSLRVQAAGSRLELLAENDSDANPRIDTRNDLNLNDAQAAVSIPSPSIPPSIPKLGTSRVIFAIGRIAVAIPFIMSALFTLVDADASATFLASKLLPLPGPLAQVATSIEATVGLPFATTLVIAGATLELAAGALMATGILTRVSSLLLLIFAGIWIYSLPWDFQNGVQPDQIIRALKEISIVGALLILSSLPRPHKRYP